MKKQDLNKIYEDFAKILGIKKGKILVNWEKKFWGYMGYKKN